MSERLVLRSAHWQQAVANGKTILSCDDWLRIEQAKEDARFEEQQLKFAEVGDTYWANDDDSFMTTAISLFHGSKRSPHEGQIEVYGNVALARLVAELLNNHTEGRVPTERYNSIAGDIS